MRMTSLPSPLRVSTTYLVVINNNNNRKWSQSPSEQRKNHDYRRNKNAIPISTAITITQSPRELNNEGHIGVFLHQLERQVTRTAVRITNKSPISIQNRTKMITLSPQ